MSPFRCFLVSCLAGGLLLSASGASAHSLPAPSEFYFDEDRNASQPVVVVKGDDAAVVDRLAKMIERNPRAYEPLLQLAGIAMRDGRTDLGRSLYQRAIDAMGSNNRLERSARWHYGWDLHRAGDDVAALDQWGQVAHRGPTRGSWVPTTLALGLWKAGNKDEAVKWYAAAVRTHPDRWSSPADIAALLPDWSEADRATLIEVQHAWAANPPAWP